MRIILSGDTHGDRNQVRWLLAKAKTHDADGVFVLGDFGVFDHMDDGAFTNGVAVDANRAGKRVWFLPGNHENYDILDELVRDRPRDADGFVTYHSGLSGLLYSPRGHRWTWDGVSFLSLGGAYSVDKAWRVTTDAISAERARDAVKRGHTPRARDLYAMRHTHYRWWPQEEINDVERDLAMQGGVVDVMLAHDKPLAAPIPWNRKNIMECQPNQAQLQTVVEAVKPRLYVHGHFHYAYETLMESTGTFVKGLDCDPESSRNSGGSGKRHLSYAVLDLNTTGLSRVSLTWQTDDGREAYRGFGPIVKSRDEG